jgi:hypothetical protein
LSQATSEARAQIAPLIGFMAANACNRAHSPRTEKLDGGSARGMVEILLERPLTGLSDFTVVDMDFVCRAHHRR